MAIKKRFTVYDSKAELYLSPFYAITRGVGIRMFVAAAQSAEHDFGKFPADYTLFEIGEFDEGTALTQDYEAPVNLGTALSYQEAGAKR